MGASRKILCIFVLGATAFGGLGASAAASAAGGTEGKSPPELAHVAVSQAGRDLIVSFRTRRSVPLARLERLPRVRSADSAYLCAEFRQRRDGGGRRLCVGGSAGAHRRAGLELFNAAGRTTGKRTLDARVKRGGARKLVLALEPGLAGLRPDRYHWRAIESRGGCDRSSACGEALPARGTLVFRLRPVRAVGCTGAAPVLDRNGPRDGNVVALTFDDGPSSYTPGFLNVLRDKHAVGTFFEVGQEMPGREGLMRRVLREGSEIGNHTMHHAFYPGYSEIAGASRLIDAYTHFEPCLFRPPGGGVNGSVIATAASLGMRTITWDVDPTDWSNPGSGAVYSRVVGAARPGSIILMHDGGGYRGGTLAALPSIIDTLRARGYRFATVSDLLGKRLVYRPYG
jgi:peptidoglycan-N-acetylglucosamine deacetylase